MASFQTAPISPLDLMAVVGKPYKLATCELYNVVAVFDFWVIAGLGFFYFMVVGCFVPIVGYLSGAASCHFRLHGLSDCLKCDSLRSFSGKHAGPTRCAALLVEPVTWYLAGVYLDTKSM